MEATLPVHRLTVEDICRMVEAGVLGEHDRVELVEGVLVDMVPIGAEHEEAVERLIDHFAGVAARKWKVRVQSMLVVGGGYLLPDLLVIDPPGRGQLPTAARLVVEVAQTSLERDAAKARDYAAANIPEYWIVDLQGRRLVVHRQPLGGTYQEITTFADGTTVKPLLADAPAIDVGVLLGV